MRPSITTIGAILLSISVYAQKQEIVDSLLSQLRYANPTEKVDTYNLLAEQFHKTDSLQTKKYVSKAIELSNQIGYDKGVAEAYFHLAWMYTRSGNNEMAQLYFDRVVTLAQEINYIERWSDAYRGLGYLAQQRGNYEEALELHAKSLDLSTEIDYLEGIASSYNNMGLVYDDRGDYVKALDYYFQSLTIREKLDDIGATTAVYNNIGVVYYYQENFPKSLEFHEKSLRINQQLEDDYAIARSTINIGLVLEKMGSYDSAANYYLKSIQIGERINFKYLLGWAYDGMANVALQRKDYGEAASWITKSLAVRTSIGRNQDLAKTYITLGKNYFLQSRYGESLKYYREGAKIARDIGNLLTYRDALEGISTCYEKLNNYEQAYLTHIKFKEYADSILNEESSQKQMRLEAEFEFQQDRDSIQFAVEQERAQFELELAQKRVTQLSTFIGLAFVTLLLAAIYIFYRSKQRANRKLVALNKEIKSQRDHLRNTLVELEETQEKLVQSEKMASLGILSAGLAHEINNPLNFIKGSTSQLLDELSEDSSARVNQGIYMNHINEGVDRISKIVKSLSHFGANTSTLKDECDLHEIIENCLIVLDPHLKDRVIVKKDFHEMPLIIKGSDAALHQIFHNLLANAEQAINGHGEIEIKTYVNEDYIGVSISDTGQGIAKENLSKIGDPFFTTKAPGQGSGLGLYITNDLIKSHGGSMTFSSEQMKGSQFLVRLPKE